MSLTVAVEVPPRDRDVLEGWLRSPSIRAGLGQRARMVLLAADGVATGEIAHRVGTSKQTVITWKHRYVDEGVGGLEDRPRSGRPRWTDDVEIVLRTLERPPERLGVTHWSSRLLARELGLSNVKVAEVWREYGLQPWRQQTFKFSTDPELEAKVRDVVGLYLNPPVHGALCGRVGSGWGAPPFKGTARFPSPPAEPGVRVSTHRALRGLGPVGIGHAVVVAHGEGMLFARQR